MIQELDTFYDTIYFTGPGNNNVLITIQPQSITPNTIQAVLLLHSGEEIINNNEILEGDLCMLLKNSLKKISFEIDDDGNLIVNADDANNYSLDSEGNLIYTYR